MFEFSYLSFSDKFPLGHLRTTFVRCSFCKVGREGERLGKHTTQSKLWHDRSTLQSAAGKNRAADRRGHSPLKVGLKIPCKISTVLWHSDSTSQIPSYGSYLISVFVVILCPSRSMRFHKKTFLWASVYGWRDQSRIIMVPFASLAFVIRHPTIVSMF